MKTAVNAPVSLPIPAQLDAITPEWLTLALGEHPGIDAGRVSTASFERIGEGVGLMGELARLRLGWDSAAPHLPRQLIVKLPGADENNRASGQILGLYEREAHFYLELAEQLPVRTPRCFHAAAEADPNAPDDPEEIERVLARLPVWCVRGVVRFAEWQARRAPRAAILLLEDLEGLRAGDQLHGGNQRDWERAIDGLSRLHAAGWQSDSWLGHSWLARLRPNARFNQALFSRQYKRLPAVWENRLRGNGRRLGAWLARRGLALMDAVTSGPETLCHSDYRLDNLFFDDAKNELVVLDWQLASRGPGVLDLAYFLSGVLDASVDRESEESMVERYHAGLVSGGVRNYPWPVCLADYRCAHLASWQRCIAAASAVEPGDARGIAMLESWWDRMSERLDGIDADEILRAKQVQK